MRCLWPFKHKHQGDVEKVAERAKRAAHRRKRRQEMIEQEIADKLRKIDEPGKLVEENFHHVT